MSDDLIIGVCRKCLRKLDATGSAKDELLERLAALGGDVRKIGCTDRCPKRGVTVAVGVNELDTNDRYCFTLKPKHSDAKLQRRVRKRRKRLAR